MHNFLVKTYYKFHEKLHSVKRKKSKGVTRVYQEDFSKKKRVYQEDIKFESFL